MRAKTKLPYDVPYEIYETLRKDAQIMGISATQLLIKLIEQNHKEVFEMNRFEAIESIFEQHGFTIDGQEFWKNLEIKAGEKEEGYQTIEDILYFNEEKHVASYGVEISRAYDEGEDLWTTDIKLKSIYVGTPGGKCVLSESI